MRVRRIVAGVLIVIGAIWILQGVDILQGSSMTGHAIWAVFGTILIIFGVALARPRSRS